MSLLVDVIHLAVFIAAGVIAAKYGPTVYKELNQ